MSLFAISAFNSSSSNLRIVGNSQTRQESLAAAQMAIESTISSANFSINPAAVASSPVLVDIDGDGKTDYTAMLSPAPECTRAKPKLESELPAMVPGSVDPYSDCRSSAGGLPCTDTEWNIRAQVTDSSSSTRVAINQGIGILLLPEDESNCK